MGAYSFVTADVFTSRRFCGNPLAVFPDAGGLAGEEMQAIAAEFNLSETTFVLPPENPDHTARVRIFNPKYEMPFAGHPNVGTAYVLAQLGKAQKDVLLFEEIAGLVEVRLDASAVYDVEQGIEMNDPACCEPPHGALRTASAPLSAVTAFSSCAAKL